ncbi:VIT1/CCC1 transporter family protein [Candidatus Uhrbacteria bacterium]|nr:VIT1/CCC1 transporter family protein [Candidatus Uhrbacteria bacterium]
MRASRRSLWYRNVIFGVEDSLISTLGLLAGLAIAGADRSNLLVTGAVLIGVEAFSMGVGSLLTEHSVEELESKRALPMHRAALGGCMMFVSYVSAGIVPLAPYVFLPVDGALMLSIVFTLTALFALGVCVAWESRTRMLRHGFEMLLLGGAAIAVGMIVGQLAHIVV